MDPWVSETLPATCSIRRADAVPVRGSQAFEGFLKPSDQGFPANTSGFEVIGPLIHCSVDIRHKTKNQAG